MYGIDKALSLVWSGSDLEEANLVEYYCVIVCWLIVYGVVHCGVGQCVVLYVVDSIAWDILGVPGTV